MAIKIGLIGCGDIAAFHAGGYLEIPLEAHVTAVGDVIETRAQAMARYVGGARVFGDFHALIAEAEVDAVDICLPHHLHKDAILAAAAAGKHILCEKPLCLDRQQADEIGRAVAEGGVTLMCAHNQLFDPAIQRAKEMLAVGALGWIYEIRTVDAIRLTDAEIAGLNWRSKKETMGGGELIDTGYHTAYTLLYLVDSDPVEVTAILGRYRIQAMDGEDSAQVLVRFADGSVGHIVSSWAYEQPPGMWQFQVIGEHGLLYGQKNRLYHRDHDFEPATFVLPEVNSFHAEVADFVACLRDQRKPVQTTGDGINVLTLILAAYRSAAEKRTIVLTDERL